MLNHRDAWLATRDDVSEGVYTLPLSFLADSSGIWFASKPHRQIATNVTANRRVEVIFGGYLDAIIVDGTCNEPTAQPPIDIHDRYEAKPASRPHQTRATCSSALNPNALYEADRSYERSAQADWR